MRFPEREFLYIHSNVTELCYASPIDNIPAWVQNKKVAWLRPGKKPLFEPTMDSYELSSEYYKCCFVFKVTKEPARRMSSAVG